MPRLLTLIFLAATLFPATVHAQEVSAPNLPEQSDVRIIVDISGSMKDNDPDNLRQPAVRLLARMIPEGATAGLWTFGQYVNMLIPHRAVTTEWREQAIERSGQINSVALRTNLGKAIEVASDSYYTGGVLEETHFILLTDGKVDVSDDASINQREENRILDTLVSDLTKQGATFHPIALSSEADAEFLQQLARDSGGRFQVADSADALNRAFLEALNTAIPQEQVPIVGNAFSVDEGVTEYTALIFWGEQETSETRELELVRPDGTTITLAQPPESIRWAREAGYDLMTVSEPMAGEWRINGELGEGSRVTVVSDLRMAVSPVPTSFSEDSPIDLEIAFFENGEKITNRDFLQVLDVRLSITSEDGRSGTKLLSGDEPPKDGVYADTIGRLPASGLYRIEVIADGQTFGRKFSTRTGFVSTETTAESQAGDESPEAAVGGEPEAEPSADPARQVVESESESSKNSEPLITSPIDVSKVEEPDASELQVAEPPTPESPVPEDDAVSALPVPVWAIGAGVGGVGLMAVIWLAMRKRQAQRSEQAMAAAERETVADLDDKSEPEVAAATDASPEEATEEVSEDIPEVTDEMQPSDRESESEPDEDEFGLDDFDLSEFDELPEYDGSDPDHADDETQQKPDDSDQKK
ncbi:VWA domain-containing protein [Marinobacter sp. F4206]|uniref:VWA domain-containing protein n=1 Tax=Marinobacter sp. F4206 TaxID=2861777 RepID=UPI001C601465|nr:vWA domain-containing protein [Marinobacter sp. F4206]MBW4933371.1 VWA domain-containing protein [Marinobacter sp. F4206]